jgi:hypothetical protein
MKKNAFVLLAMAILLSGCTGPSDQDYGQSVLSVAPIVFLVSMGFQYLFFRIWKRKWRALTMAWLPNLVFLILLIAVMMLAFLLRDIEFRETELLVLALVVFGASYLTVLFLITRIWLFFDHTRVFTWASILTLSLYILPAFPMVAGLTEETLIGDFALALWILPGSVLRLLFRDSMIANAGVVILFLILLVEAWFATRKEGL